MAVLLVAGVVLHNITYSVLVLIYIKLMFIQSPGVYVLYIYKDTTLESSLSSSGRLQTENYRN